MKEVQWVYNKSAKERYCPSCRSTERLSEDKCWISVGTEENYRWIWNELNEKCFIGFPSCEFCEKRWDECLKIGH